MDQPLKKVAKSQSQNGPLKEVEKIWNVLLFEEDF